MRLFRRFLTSRGAGERVTVLVVAEDVVDLAFEQSTFAPSSGPVTVILKGTASPNSKKPPSGSLLAKRTTAARPLRTRIVGPGNNSL